MDSCANQQNMYFHNEHGIFTYKWWCEQASNDDFYKSSNSSDCWVSISGSRSGALVFAEPPPKRNATEPWNAGTLEPCNLGNLEPFWDPGALGFDPDVLEPCNRTLWHSSWSPGTLQSYGTLRPATLESWKPARLEPCPLPCNLGTLEPSNLRELWNPRS